MIRAMARVLIVDDEPTLIATLDYNLRRDGHEVFIARDGVAAVDQARAQRPDVIVLDVMLPRMDGLEACRAIRGFSPAPILLLTARDAEIDKVVGLEIGADDYITKPFSMRELLARVKAQVRRSARVGAAAGKPAPEPEHPVVVGAIEIDPRARTVRRNGEPVHFKPKEFALLLFLATNRGQVFTREQLLERVWGYAYTGDTRTVDVHVRWIREHIEETPGKPRIIQTIRGVGYRMVD